MESLVGGKQITVADDGKRMRPSAAVLPHSQIIGDHLFYLGKKQKMSCQEYRSALKARPHFARNPYEKIFTLIFALPSPFCRGRFASVALCTGPDRGRSSQRITREQVRGAGS